MTKYQVTTQERDGVNCSQNWFAWSLRKSTTTTVVEVCPKQRWDNSQNSPQEARSWGNLCDLFSWTKWAQNSLIWSCQIWSTWRSSLRWTSAIRALVKEHKLPWLWHQYLQPTKTEKIHPKLRSKFAKNAQVSSGQRLVGNLVIWPN